jgi:hypothetical protein
MDLTVDKAVICSFQFVYNTFINFNHVHGIVIIKGFTDLLNGNAELPSNNVLSKPANGTFIIDPVGVIIQTLAFY